MNNLLYSQLDQITDHKFAPRVLVTIFIGLAIAGGLTWFMHALIESSHQELDNSVRTHLLDFVRVKRNETSQPKTIKPDRPMAQDAPPAPPTPQASSEQATTSLQVSVPQLSSTINVDVGAIGLGVGDGEYLPIVKIAPVYPQSAKQKGIEGSCLVEYTVTPLGTTKDVKAIRSECPRVFIHASIGAAKRFKYKPRVIDGVPIEVPNVRNRFDFTLRSAEQEQ